MQVHRCYFVLLVLPILLVMLFVAATLFSEIVGVHYMLVVVFPFISTDILS